MAKRMKNKSFIPTYAYGGFYRKQYGLGSFIKDKALPFLGDSAKLYADNMLSTFGASDVIKDDAYKNKAFKDISGVTSKIFSTAGQVGANIIAPGIGGQLMSGAQQGVGSVAGEQSKMANMQQDQLATQQQEMLKKQAIDNLPAQHDYAPTFADGGNLPTANTFINALRNVKTYFSGEPDKNLVESQYKPTISKDKDAKYYIRPGMKEDVFKDLTSEEVKKMYNHSGEFSDIYKALINDGKDRPNKADEAFPKNKAGYHGIYNRGHGSFKGEFNLGRYRVDAGKDEKGKYISFSDTYDWNGMQNLGKMPINFYDRIYEDDWNNLKNEDIYTETKIYPMFAYGGKVKYPDGGKLTEDDKQLYKISRALELGYTPDSTGHMSSRDYKTGMMLKYPAHPTFNKSIKADRKIGYNPLMDPSGNIYTINPKDLPREGYFAPDKKAYGGIMNSYAGGGSLKKAGGGTVGDLDNTSYISTGGTHEQSKLGGVPMGKDALVEQGEYIWEGPKGKYVFSNRF